MGSEEVVSPTIQSRVSPCENTDRMGRGGACGGACHTVMIEVIGLSVFMRISFKYGESFGLPFPKGASTHHRLLWPVWPLFGPHSRIVSRLPRF